jgi:phosphatidylserine/phosphatidylglycerophosphate/cardiolipin synthase-like enzyme/uncharacterized membrane protein YdjX (TVP38/TMEM64 family)
MILRPGENIWRLERASRAGVLIDGANYFLAVRQALLKAERQVFIVGWDIHSQTRLVGPSGEADDGFPELLGDLLTALVRRRPQLKISLLLWDYAVLYASERELFPTYTFRWNTPPQVSFCLDDAVPIGSSQHQKLVIIDDAVAFSGGLDITVRRWDTGTHAVGNPQRVDPAGDPYAPFHDVQMIVDGAAAAALARLARDRWSMAADENLGPVAPHGDPWPDSAAIDFTDVDIGIARTCPPYRNCKGVREVEALHLDAIAVARSFIYIENQFLTCIRIAQELARRLAECPELHVLIVVPRDHEAWLEGQSMRHGRLQFLRVLQDAGVAARVRIVSPTVTEGDRSADTMVHAKVTIVDDRLLRVGSANLNNRSMGTDAECDLSIEAADETQRDAIIGVRNRLLADHCGVTVDEVVAALSEAPSPFAAVERLSKGSHRLVPTHDVAGEFDVLVPYLDQIADPECPIGAEQFVSSFFGGYVRPRYATTTLKVCAAAAILLVLALIWHFTPLATWTDPKTLHGVLQSLANSPWGAFAVIGAFLVGGLTLFPVTLLIAATAAAFGPLLGFALSGTGALASAILGYLIGAKVGKQSLRDLLGPRLNRVRKHVRRKGLIAVASIRLLPIAPFTVVNLAAGASDIRLFDFVLGTALGLMPGLITLALLGHEVSELFTHPTLGQFAILAGAVLMWVAVSIGVQVIVNRYGDKA